MRRQAYGLIPLSILMLGAAMAFAAQPVQATDPAASPVPAGADAASSADAAPANSDAGAPASTDNSGSTPAAGENSSAPDSSGASAPDNAIFNGTTASDHDLEMIVFGAYTGAYNRALQHQNFFNSDDFPYSALVEAMRATLEKEGYDATNIAPAAVPTADAAKACATDGKIDLRVAFNNGGVGVVLAAVSDKRMSAYEYDPTTSSDLVITHAADCLIPGGAVAPSDNGKDRLTPPAH